MIKGVNRQVVEVNETDCDYFERILFFVKPEYACVSQGKIRERAGIIAGRTDKAPPTKIRGNGTTQTLKIVLSLLGGIALGILMAKLI